MLISVRLTHQDLANMVVSTREAVSKVISEFQRDDLIEMRNRCSAILDRGALVMQASGRSGLSLDSQLPI